MDAKRSLLIPFLSLACPALLEATQVGAVQRSLRIHPGSGGLVGPLDHSGYFGFSQAALGDLNGDGVGDLAVSAPLGGASGAGAIWILFLRADGTVQAQQKITSNTGGFSGTLAAGSWFGRGLARVGDLDGDGLTELATVSGQPDRPPASAPTRLWILFLGRDGAVKKQTQILLSDPIFVPPTSAAAFTQCGLAALGDLDGDGLGDLALGAPRDSDGEHEAGAVWILRLGPEGTPKGAHKISSTHGGFAGVLEEDAYFGTAVLPLDDLDGDGNRELLVSAGYFDDGVWVLHLDDDERVLSQRRFDSADYGLLWRVLNRFASTDDLAWLGDLDGDGVGELALGFGTENWPGGPRFEGGVAIAFLRRDGSVKKRLRISHQRGGLGDIPASSLFGLSIAALGDLDGDGAPELSVGAPAVPLTGGLWILSLARSAVRNGSGVNPVVLSQAAEPAFGQTWTATLDCSGLPGGRAVLFGFSQPTSGVFTPFGELLVTGERLFRLEAVGARNPVRFAGTVPPSSIALLDLPIYVQGMCAGAGGARLSNALGILLGQ